MFSEAQMPLHDDSTISVRNLTKTYRLFNHPGDRIKQFFSLGMVRYYQEFTALKNISFDIKKGETVGIIGRNGSGKSTLLQIVCGILKPTSGAVRVRGRVSALLELGAGFNPDFTGRENVYFQGALMGFTKAQMDERFDKITTFADIGEFIDQPVRTYSSGMFVRLAFAAMIHVDADVLVIDEALAVGDSAFQAKCLLRLKAIQANGNATILFVSHDTMAIHNLCTRVLTLQAGQLTHDSAPGQAISHYSIQHTLPTSAVIPKDNPLRLGPRHFATLISITVMNIHQEPTTYFAMGDAIIIELTFNCHEDMPEGRFGILFSNERGVLLHDFASGFSGIIGFPAGRHAFRITTGPILAYPGHYHLGAWIQHSKGIPPDDCLRDALTIQITDAKKVGHPEANFSGIRCSNSEIFLPCSFERIQ